ncbi:MAG: hypothetical protein KA715_00570 [Xanthomonadaceae bacterium]|nr:hypothetical protein [Xanthomonadaceae bacterium]
MKQLFYALALLAVVTSAYLKAVQLQDDAARELAQVLDEQRKNKPQEMSRSFEAVAKQVEAISPVEKLVVVTTTAVAPESPVDNGDRDPIKENIEDAEAQIADLRTEPEFNALFEGKQPAHLYAALRRTILITKNVGLVRNQGAVMNRDWELFEAQPLEAYQAVIEIDTNISPDLRREYSVEIERLKTVFEAKVNSIRDQERQNRQESNHE